MSATASDNMTSKLIARLIKAAGAKQVQEPAIDAEVYDWRSCRYFNAAELGVMQDFAGQTAGCLSERLTAFYNCEFNATVNRARQIYASQFNDECQSGEKDYNLVFKDENGEFAGLVTISLASAAKLVGLLLGDNESEGQKELSKLEETFLSDIAASFVNALLQANENCRFSFDADITNEPLFLDISATEEMFSIALDLQKAGDGSKAEAYILVRCGKLDAVCGKSHEEAKAISQDEIETAVVNSIANVDLPVEAELDKIKLTFEQVMTLERDDVILMNKKISDGIDVIVQDKRLFTGQLAKSEGAKALVIAAVNNSEKQSHANTNLKQLGEPVNG